MIEIRRSALVRFTAEQMFDLINDVESYPRRFRWCSGAKVISSKPDELTARLDLKVAGMTQSFTTRNRLEPPHRIAMNLVEGPFRSLTGEWLLTPLGDKGSKIAFALDFEYAGFLIAPIIRSGFEKLADKLVDEFCREAQELYG